jgi:ketosteroid isomerase-like protein
MNDLEEVIDSYHRAADEFSRGDAEPVKALYAHTDDVTLANPFVGLPVHGWPRVVAGRDLATSNFRDGAVTRFERVATYVGGDLATIVELEEWQAKVAHRDEATSFLLRVTTTFRRDGDAWNMVHRHADPISTPDPDGPLRAS